MRFLLPLLLAGPLAFAAAMPHCAEFAAALDQRRPIRLRVPAETVPKKLNDILTAAGVRMEKMDTTGMNPDEFDATMADMMLAAYAPGETSDREVAKRAVLAFIKDVQENRDSFPENYFPVIEYLVDYWVPRRFSDMPNTNAFRTSEVNELRKDGESQEPAVQRGMAARQMMLIYKNLVNLQHAREMYEKHVKNFKGNADDRQLLVLWGHEILHDYNTVFDDLVAVPVLDGTGRAIPKEKKIENAANGIKGFDAEVLGEIPKLEALVDKAKLLSVP